MRRLNVRECWEIIFYIEDRKSLPGFGRLLCCLLSIGSLHLCDIIGKSSEDNAETVCACIGIADGLFADCAGSAEFCNDGFGAFRACDCGFCAECYTVTQRLAVFCRLFESVCTGFQSVDQSLVTDDRAFAEGLFARFVNARIRSLEDFGEFGKVDFSLPSAALPA